MATNRKVFVFEGLVESCGLRQGLQIEVAHYSDKQPAANKPISTRSQNRNYADYVARIHSI